LVMAETAVVERGVEIDDASVSIVVASEVLDVETPIEIKHELIQVNQFAKIDELRLLLLNCGENYKDGGEGTCECKMQMEICQCKKSMVVFVNRRMTVDCVRILLASSGIKVASIHCAMDKDDRERNLTNFYWRRCPIMVMMASEVATHSEVLKDVDWLVNYDLPMKIDEYKARIEMAHREGKFLLVTSFYDRLMDSSLVEDLTKILRGSGQPVPEWLVEEASDESEKEAESDG